MSLSCSAGGQLFLLLVSIHNREDGEVVKRWLLGVISGVVKELTLLVLFMIFAYTSALTDLLV